MVVKIRRQALRGSTLTAWNRAGARPRFPFFWTTHPSSTRRVIQSWAVDRGTPASSAMSETVK